MNCPVCDIMDNEHFVIYQDKFAVAYLSQDPAVEGHVVIAPRNHIPILEQVPGEILEHLFIIANRISISVFELFNAQGTNIIVNNGIPAGQNMPHFSISVLPRKENDGLNFRWAPKQISEQDMQGVLGKVKDRCDYIGHEVPKQAPVVVDKKEELVVEEVDERIKSLERIP
ncbi:HIT family protein [Candidatus Woesearchaeota archaeon]|nr:HIT family protein [Candidatus Woesearchaeota archaeon]